MNSFKKSNSSSGLVVMLLLPLLFFPFNPCKANLEDLFEEIISQIHFDADALAKQGYLSAHGYLERTQLHERNEPSINVYKVFEVEFNAKGWLIYSRYSKLLISGNTFGTTYQHFDKFTYDDQKNILRHEEKDRHGQSLFEYTYAANNKPATVKYSWNNEPYDSSYFKWVGETITAFTYTNLRDQSDVTKPTYEFDAKGRLTKSSYGDSYRVEKSYTDTDTSETCHSRIFRDGSLSHDQITQYNQFDKLTYIYAKDTADTLYQMRITYDAYQNITSVIYDLYPDEYDRKLQAENPNERFKFRRTIRVYFENHYQHGLLFSRLIRAYGYESHFDIERVYMQRIHFESLPLTYSTWYVEPKRDYSDDLESVDIIISPEDVQIEETPVDQSDEKKEKKKKN